MKMLLGNWQAVISRHDDALLVDFDYGDRKSRDLCQLGNDF